MRTPNCTKTNQSHEQSQKNGDTQHRSNAKRRSSAPIRRRCTATAAGASYYRSKPLFDKNIHFPIERGIAVVVSNPMSRRLKDVPAEHSGERIRRLAAIGGGSGQGIGEQEKSDESHGN